MRIATRIFTALVSMCFVGMTLVNAQTDSEQAPAYFSASADASLAYYAQWKYPDVEIARDGLGIYFLNEKNPLATAMRFTLARHTRKGWVWGASYYRSSSSLLLDTTYVSLNGSIPLVQFDQYETTDINNYFNIFVEPRLFVRGNLFLYGHASIGLAYLEFDDYTIPVNGGLVQIATRRASNANFMELQNAFGFTGRWRINPFYSLFASTRYNWLVSVGTTETIDLAVGVELNLARGGVPR